MHFTARLWQFLVVVVFVTVVGVVHIIQGAPFSNDVESVGGKSDGTGSTLAFLRKYGYLEPLGSNTSEALYSEEKVTEAIRQMQHFGAVPETGKLDKETLELLTKRRCGVPDIILNSAYADGNKRKERFVLGSNGWNKRRLSYRLENWSPKLRPEDVHADIYKAMKIWGEYAHLTFINRTDYDQVDIAISFGRGHHGDRFPFDGEGGTLAHAYFPQNTPGLSGDIHFDGDEPWYHHEQGTPVSPPSRGVSFMDVALHELGHSLGLAHSPSQDSVMFPYYKAPPGDGGDPKLGKDDIMALYHLYISRNIGDGDDGDVPPPRRTTPRSTTTTHRTSYTTTTTTSPNDPSETTTKQSSTGDESLPDLCKGGGKYDTIAFLRNELFVFSGEYMWRWVEKGQSAGGTYPVHTTRLFPFLGGVKKIDAAFERESDGSIIFISGGNYWTFDGSKSGGPLPLSDFGLSESGVDAAFVWGKNRMTYFFKGHEYWRYNETTLEDSSQYPANIQERWRGIPSPISSVFTYKDGKTYFFRGQEFWQFNDQDIQAEEGDFPMSTPSYWFNCPVQQ